MVVSLALFSSALAAHGHGFLDPPLTTEPNLRRVLKYISSRETWEKRRASVRQALLHGAGLDPLPPRTPLNPIFSQFRNRDGFQVGNVAFEATPGFFVTGNLFIPLNRRGPFPAIILSHGHFGPWQGYARTLPENQILATRLAQMGAVVLAYDMVGWGDSNQLDHPDDYGFLHIFGNQTRFNDGTKNNLLELQIWDSVRATDFILSLEDDSHQPLVDPSRIGVTGASGGGTQSLNLAAADSRISAAAMVVMISSDFTGDDHCEDGMPVHTVRGQAKTNNTEIAATLAPKPVLIISDGQDWTQNFPRDDYPYLRAVWNLYGQGSDAAVHNAHFAREGHDYGVNKRSVAYDFFADVFGLERLPNTGDPSQDNREGVVLEDRDSLRVFTPQFPRPDIPMTHLLAP
jgi:dienelactone hydrolase